MRRRRRLALAFRVALGPASWALSIACCLAHPVAQTINLDYVTINLDCVNEALQAWLPVLSRSRHLRTCIILKARVRLQDLNSMDLASCQYDVEACDQVKGGFCSKLGLRGRGGQPRPALVLDLADDRGGELLLASHLGRAASWLGRQATTPSLDVPVMEAHWVELYFEGLQCVAGATRKHRAVL